MKLGAGPDNVLWLLQAVEDRKYDFSGESRAVQYALNHPWLWHQQALHDACLHPESQGSQAACSS